VVKHLNDNQFVYPVCPISSLNHFISESKIHPWPLVPLAHSIEQMTRLNDLSSILPNIMQAVEISGRIDNEIL
jgi:hypothetical protein